MKRTTKFVISCNIICLFILVGIFLNDLNQHKNLLHDFVCVVIIVMALIPLLNVFDALGKR